jgi:hypothetical protein
VETALVNMVEAAKSARHHVGWYDIMSDGPLDPSRCPLCWQQNKCGIAEDSGTCWCLESSKPSEMLDQVPHQPIGLANLCQTCLSII